MKPKVATPDRTLYTYIGEIGDDAEVVGAHISPPTVISGRSIDIDGCRVSRVQLPAAPGLRLRRSQLKGVDAANSEIDESGWRDVHVDGCRLTGARLNSVAMTRVVMSECRADLIQMQNGRLSAVRFESCDLRGAFFNGTSMPGTVFEGSDLSGADFSGADISGSDLRRAIIEDIRIAPDQVQKVIVSSDQALYLAKLFGLDVRE